MATLKYGFHGHIHYRPNCRLCRLGAAEMDRVYDREIEEEARKFEAMKATKGGSK